MRDRGMKKWQPFNSVVPMKKLLDRDEKNYSPNLSMDEIDDYEEKLKDSFYNSTIVEVAYLNFGKIEKFSSSVIKMDILTKNIYFKNGKKINFRQIYSIK